MRKNKLGDFILNMVADHVDNEIVLYAKSKESDADWYGDFNYFGNPLDRYHESKMCHVEYEYGSGRGCGVSSMTVTTTMKFLEMMGWEDDSQYQIKL